MRMHAHATSTAARGIFGRPNALTGPLSHGYRFASGARPGEPLPRNVAGAYFPASRALDSDGFDYSMMRIARCCKVL